jgi:hypothetical protein
MLSRQCRRAPLVHRHAAPDWHIVASSLELPPLYRVVSATAPLAQECADAAGRGWRTGVHEIVGAMEVGSIANRRTTQDDI